MNIQELTTYRFDNRPVTRDFFDSVDQYSVRPSKWSVLTRLKIWAFLCIWNWCEPCRVVSENKITRIAFDKEKLLEMLQEHQANLFKVLWEKDFSYIVVGHKQWMQLTNEADDIYPHRFYCDNFAALNFGQSIKVIGIDVMVVPWIDGIFLLPKLEK